MTQRYQSGAEDRIPEIVDRHQAGCKGMFAEIASPDAASHNQYPVHLKLLPDRCKDRVMHLLFPSLALALAIASPCGATEPLPQWKVALPGWNYEFPRDHAHHPDFQTEWWYFTGNLRSESGRDFGFQLTFFRQGVLSGEVEESEFLKRDMRFAHFAVSDFGSRMFHHFQRICRGSFGQSGFGDGSRLVWIRDWSCEIAGPGTFRLQAEEGDVAIDLVLRSEKPPVIHGTGTGVSQKSEGPGRASHYYSLTRLQTSGRVRLGAETHVVTGTSWFDQEWATNQLAAHQTGWDWFSLQFDDGSELMLFQIRTRDGGRDPYSSGTFIAPDGTSVHIPVTGFSLEPARRWKSPKTRGEYPVDWNLRVESLGLELALSARMDGQELATEPFAYWEGAISARGRRGGRTLSGVGYLEMTGYAGQIVGLQAPEAGSR